MSENREFAPAKRGDLVLIETVHRDYIIGSSGLREYWQYELHEVTSITRDGQIKAVRGLRYEYDQDPVPLARMVGVDRKWVISKAQLGVDAARKLVCSIRWEHEPDSVRGYWSSYGEAVAAIRQAVSA